MEKKYQVSVVKKNENTLKETVKTALDLIGGLEKFVRPGQKVMIKPNYTGDLDPNEGGVTSVETQEAIIQVLNDYGIDDITIAEGCGCVHIGTMRIFDNVGVTEMAKRYNVKLVDLNKCPTREIFDERFKEIESVKVSEGLFGYDLIINVPVIKTHAQCVATCAVKNMKGGVAPKEKRHFHAVHLHQAIADFNLILPKTIVIVDGIVGQEGMGPAEGDRVPLGLIIAGDNAVAVDGVVLSIMGIDPQEVKHVIYAADLGIGSYKLEDIEVLGEKIHNVRRPFRKAETDIKEYPGVEIFESNACSGCINSLVIALNRIRGCGDLDKFKDLQLCIGTDKPKGADYKNFFYIGKCALTNYNAEVEKHPDNVHFIAGCAPAGLEIEERIREVYGIERSNPLYYAAAKKATDK